MASQTWQPNLDAPFYHDYDIAMTRQPPWWSIRLEMPLKPSVNRAVALIVVTWIEMVRLIIPLRMLF